jgi:hypothetical protein
MEFIKKGDEKNYPEKGDLVTIHYIGRVLVIITSLLLYLA